MKNMDLQISVDKNLHVKLIWQYPINTNYLGESLVKKKKNSKLSILGKRIDFTKITIHTVFDYNFFFLPHPLFL